MAKKTTIRCPYCGYEYLPAEIYYPEDFLGNPSDIIREEGNIIGFDGEDMNTVETFECEHCGKKFSVDASITFKTTQIKSVFDEDEYVSKIEN